MGEGHSNLNALSSDTFPSIYAMFTAVLHGNARINQGRVNQIPCHTVVRVRMESRMAPHVDR